MPPSHITAENAPRHLTLVESPIEHLVSAVIEAQEPLEVLLAPNVYDIDDGQPISNDWFDRKTREQRQQYFDNGLVRMALRGVAQAMWRRGIPIPAKAPSSTAPASLPVEQAYPNVYNIADGSTITSAWVKKSIKKDSSNND